MYVGQTIAIPVLDRHITHSAGLCAVQSPTGYRSSDCVMADAVRGRFPEATNVDVGMYATTFDLPGGTFAELQNADDMQSVIGEFDRQVDAFIAKDDRSLPLDEAMKSIYAAVRAAAPRVVHAKVSFLGNEEA